jgi:hypothetical protein
MTTHTPHPTLRKAKITEADLPLFARYHITDWSGQVFEREALLRLGTWWVNEDKTVLFKALGGGAFEIPEMYALVCMGSKVHIECGGGGEPATVMEKTPRGYHTTVNVSHIDIPPVLLPHRDAVLDLVFHAFASSLDIDTADAAEQFTVRFRSARA